MQYNESELYCMVALLFFLIGKKFHPVLETMETWGKEYISYMKESEGTEEAKS